MLPSSCQNRDRLESGKNTRAAGRRRDYRPILHKEARPFSHDPSRRRGSRHNSQCLFLRCLSIIGSSASYFRAVFYFALHACCWFGVRPISKLLSILDETPLAANPPLTPALPRLDPMFDPLAFTRCGGQRSLWSLPVLVGVATLAGFQKLIASSEVK